MKAEHAFQN